MKHYNTLLAGALCAGLLSWSDFTAATIVEFNTSLGPIQVNLYDDTTPETVANFLNYVNSGAYANSIIHRSVPDFIIQGGGFVYDFSPTLENIESDSPVMNEPVYSNVRGTIAMAKLENLPDSATSQFFFNLVDNSANLDGQNSGFTVFGQVIDDGMAVVDAMAALPRLNSLPLRNYPPADTSDFVPTEEHYIIIENVTIWDAATDTAAALTRPLTTNTNTGGGTDTGGTTSGGGGGHLGLFGLLLLGFSTLIRRSGGRR